MGLKGNHLDKKRFGGSPKKDTSKLDSGPSLIRLCAPSRRSMHVLGKKKVIIAPGIGCSSGHASMNKPPPSFFNLRLREVGNDLPGVGNEPFGDSLGGNHGG